MCRPHKVSVRTGEADSPMAANTRRIEHTQGEFRFAPDFPPSPLFPSARLHTSRLQIDIDGYRVHLWREISSLFFFLPFSLLIKFLFRTILERKSLEGSEESKD